MFSGVSSLATWRGTGGEELRSGGGGDIEARRIEGAPGGSRHESVAGSFVLSDIGSVASEEMLSFGKALESTLTELVAGAESIGATGTAQASFCTGSKYAWSDAVGRRNVRSLRNFASSPSAIAQ